MFSTKRPPKSQNVSNVSQFETTAATKENGHKDWTEISASVQILQFAVYTSTISQYLDCINILY